MTLEIRELVIEARVVDDSRSGTQTVAGTAPSDAEQARWVEQVAQRVLEVLHEQWERQ